MIMHPTPVALQYTPSTLPSRSSSRKQHIVNASSAADGTPPAYAFPTATSEPAAPPQSITDAINNRPREVRPIRREAANKIEPKHKETVAEAEALIKSMQVGTNGNIEHKTAINSSTLGANDYTHRRDRSHFSIPDVIVTSSVEEGARRHYEMRVEPAKRKVSFPYDSTNTTSGLRLMESTKVWLTPAQRAALESEATLVKAIPDLRQLKLNKGKLKMPAPLAIVGRKSSEGDVKRADSTDVSSVSDSKAGWRPRRSSLSGLFSRKDREAAIAVSALPPSPTLPWHNSNPSAPAESSPTFSTISSFFTTSSSSRSSSVPSNPPSPVMSASPNQSPILIPSYNPSLPPAVVKSKKKEDLRAKFKEEQQLIKELERVDKMVRKHDQEMKKAAATRKCPDQPTVESIENSEGKSRKGLTRMSVFRQTTSSTQKPALPSYIKASDRALMEQRKQKPLEGAATCESTMERRNSSEDSPDISWNGDIWTDLPSPVEEQLISLTAHSPVRSRAMLERDYNAVASLPAVKRMSTLQRKSSGSQHAVNGNHSHRKASLRRDPMSKTKRQSLMRITGLGLDLADAPDMEWEDSQESPAMVASASFVDSNVSKLPSIKRTSLLASLYKDIEEMETTFQLEYRSIAKRSRDSAHEKEDKK